MGIGNSCSSLSWLDDGFEGRLLTEHYCTYFDHRYLPRGLAMWQSLKRHQPSAALHVLCLTPACQAILSGLELPDVTLIPLPSFEDVLPALTAVRGRRSLLEYYFTLTPFLPAFLFDRQPRIDRVTYLDADLFFFSDPQAVFDELGAASIGIIEHRFPEGLLSLGRYGRFNVGWLSFVNDASARACLHRWQAQCIEWCQQREEPGRFADQKYLDDWPERVEGVKVLQHKGANLAPWNLDRFPLEERDEVLLVAGDPLIFFHAHGFEPDSPGASGTLNLERYGVSETRLLRRRIFDPYAQALASATARVAPQLVTALLRDERRTGATALAERLRAAMKL